MRLVDWIEEGVKAEQIDNPRINKLSLVDHDDYEHWSRYYLSWRRNHLVVRVWEAASGIQGIKRAGSK